MEGIETQHPEIAPEHEPVGCLLGQPIMNVDEVIQESSTPMSVIESCAICGGSHRHGFDNGVEAISKRLSQPSHREAHCGHDAANDAPGGYWLVYTDETEGVEYDEDHGEFVKVGGELDIGRRDGVGGFDAPEWIDHCLTQIERNGFSEGVEWQTEIADGVCVEEMVGALVASEMFIDGVLE